MLNKRKALLLGYMLNASGITIDEAQEILLEGPTAAEVTAARKAKAKLQQPRVHKSAQKRYWIHKSAQKRYWKRNFPTAEARSKEMRRRLHLVKNGKKAA